MKVQLRYAAFSQTMTIFIDGHPLPAVSHLSRYQGLPFEKWCDEIISAIEVEVNGKYELVYTGRSCESRIIGQLARSSGSCTFYSAVAPSLPDTAKTRLKKLSSYVQSGLECRKIAHSVYIYTDEYPNIAECLKAPKLAFCKLQIQVCPLSGLASHPQTEPAYVLIPDSMPESFGTDLGNGSRRQMIARIGGGTKGVTVKNGVFIETIEEQNAAVLLEEYLELWTYRDLLLKAIGNIFMEESHPMYVEVQALDKQEPVTMVRFPKSVEYGEEEPVQIYSIPQGAATEDVLYRVSDESVIQITSDKIRAVGVGEAVAEAYRKGENKVIASQKITCYRRNRIQELSLLPNKNSIVVGQSFPVKYQFIPQDADDVRSIRLTSSNGLVAVVDTGLRITGRAPGSCRITAQSERAVAFCEVQVYPRLERLEIKIDKNELMVGETVQAVITRVPGDATLEKLHYSVSPSALGRYEPGVKGFYAQSPGSGELIVTSEDRKIKASVPVIVKVPPKKIDWKFIIGVIVAIVFLYILLNGI